MTGSQLNLATSGAYQMAGGVAYKQQQAQNYHHELQSIYSMQKGRAQQHQNYASQHDLYASRKDLGHWALDRVDASWLCVDMCGIGNLKFLSVCSVHFSLSIHKGFIQYRQNWTFLSDIILFCLTYHNFIKIIFYNLLLYYIILF